MSRLEDSTEPLGMTFRSRSLEDGGVETRLRFLSRGDRVRGRLVRRSTDEPAPLLVVGAPDGDCDSAMVSAAIDAWSDWAAVAAFDLPLCGSRYSDKLSQLVLDGVAADARLLWPDLERQLASDLSRGLDVLAEEPSPPSGIAYVGVGLGADIAAHFCEREARLRAFVLAAEPGSAVLVERTPDGDRVRTLTLSAGSRRVLRPTHTAALALDAECLAAIGDALRPLLGA